VNHFTVKTDPELDQSVLNDGQAREFICRVTEVAPMEDGDWSITLEVYDIYEV
jgi:hypothetical protein